MIFKFIEQHKNQFPVVIMCDILNVSQSGYYSWLSRPVSKQEKGNIVLLDTIRNLFKECNEIYGSPRIYKELCHQGVPCSENRVARLMRKDGLKAKCKRRFKATTNSKHDLPIAKNILNRCFTPPTPNQVWAGDITYIWTGEGWLYLAVVIDLFSRFIVGWSMDKTMTRHLVMDALNMAIQRRNPLTDLIFHSDRGVQYASADFQSLLANNNMRCSMSRKGNCWDNAPVESFFGSLKQEVIFHQRYESRAEARQSIFNYIKFFYNCRRLHSTLDYQSPISYEAAYRQLVA